MYFMIIKSRYLIYTSSMFVNILLSSLLRKWVVLDLSNQYLRVQKYIYYLWLYS